MIRYATLAEACEHSPITPSVVRDGDQFAVVPPYDGNLFWGLHVRECHPERDPRFPSLILPGPRFSEAVASFNLEGLRDAKRALAMVIRYAERAEKDGH